MERTEKSFMSFNFLFKNKEQHMPRQDDPRTLSIGKNPKPKSSFAASRSISPPISSIP